MRQSSSLLVSDGLKHVEEIKFNKCIYIEDACLERLSSIQSLQDSLFSLEVVSCGNVTDKGVIALHRLRSVCFSSPTVCFSHPDRRRCSPFVVPRRNLEHLFLSDLPGLTDEQTTVKRLQTALPRLDVSLDLD